MRREGVEREAPTSLYDLRRSGGCLLIGQGLKSEYSARATRDTKNSKFRQGFAWKVREVKSFGFRKCSWNFLGSLLTLQEVGFSHTIVISCLRAIQWPLGSTLTVGLVQR